MAIPGKPSFLTSGNTANLIGAISGGNMLVQSMNPKEITSEILKDISRIEKSSTQRLLKEYDRESKKFKIDKTKSYPKVYEIKTTAQKYVAHFFKKIPDRKEIQCY